MQQTAWGRGNDWFEGQDWRTPDKEDPEKVETRTMRYQPRPTGQFRAVPIRN